MKEQSSIPEGVAKEKALRDGGFSDDEVGQWKSETSQSLQNGGFSGQEIRDYFGIKNPDMSSSKQIVKDNLKAATSEDGVKEKPDPNKPVEAKTVLEAMAAGWGNSVLGLEINKKLPSTTLPENPSALQTLAASAAGFVGDAPAMAAGMLGGEVVGGPIGGVAAAFAVPSALRKALIDHYQKGDIQDASDFAQRVVGTTWEAAKGAIVGAASAVSGGAAGALAGTAAKVSAEIVAQTTVSKALEGHLPNKNDFINGAIAIGGLHAVGYVPEKIMHIYAKTGSAPNEILEAANTDPALKGELLSENPNLPKEATPPTKDAEPATEEQTTEAPKDLAKEEILSRIGEKAATEKKSLLEQSKDGFSSLYRDNLDYTKTVGKVLDQIGDRKLDETDAQVLMRLHAAVQDKVQEFVENGTRDFKTGEVNGESLINILDDYKKETGDTKLDALKAYGIAARSIELSETRGIEQTGSRETDKQFVEENPHVEKFLNRMVDYKNRVLDYVGDSGRYSKEQIQAMKYLNEKYISLKKIVEPDPITGKGAFTSKEIKKIGDSDRLIQDPILSTLQDVNALVRVAHETEATNTFIQQMGKAEDPSQFYKVSENQKGIPSTTQIAKYENGKRTLYDVPEEVADTIKRMAGAPQAMSVWTSLLKPFATILRTGTVNNPLFALRHAWRNQLTAPTLSQTGLKPFEALLYAPEYLAKGESYHNFVYDGGAVNSIMPLAKGYLDGKIYELDKQVPFIDKAWNKVKTAAQFSHWAIVMNDNIARFAEYKRMTERGASRTEAAFAAREVLPDFQKQGMQKGALQQITAFLNVHAQGVSRMAQETATNPYGYIAKNLAYITVPSILLAVAQKDDDAVKDLPEWQRYNYWTIHVPDWRAAHSLAEAMSVKNAYPSNYRLMPDGTHQVNDGTMVRIQKPFTNGILFGSAIEASLEAWKKKDPKEFVTFAELVAKSTTAVPLPTATVPVLEQMVNRNFYTQQPLVRHSMENKLPEMKYDRYTSATAQTIGKLLSYVPLVKDIGPQDARLSSPKVIENYIHGWGGTLGYYAVDVLDKGLIAAGIQPKPVKPTNTLADIPFVKEFVIRFPNAHPQSVSDFEDRYKQADEVHNSVKQLMKDGDVQGAVKLQDRYAINMERLTGVDKAIQNLNSSIQKTYSTPDIDPVQKRQLIDMMMFQMTSMAKEGNKLMDEFAKKAQK